MKTKNPHSANQSYTLSSASGSITFGPADIDSSQSSAGALVYVRRNGSSSADSLTVTRPGTSGPITYTYVGSAFWQHTVVNSSSGSGFIDAAAYGVKTPDASLPRTGSANYAVDLVGAETVADNLIGLAGQGNTSVDFAGGTVITSGSMNRAVGGPTTTNFTSVAHIDSTTNHFSGDFAYEDFGNFTGTLSGRFYGPAAQEIGAAFAAANADGRISVGTIMGRQGAGDLGNASFNAPGSGPRALTNSQTFTTIAARDNFTLPGMTGRNDSGAPSGTSTRLEGMAIRYDAATNNYLLVGPDVSIGLPPGPGASFGGGPTHTLSLGYPSLLGAVNTSYVLIGSWTTETIRTNAAYRNAFFAFGMPTPNADLVRTGAAGFKIVVQGQAADDGYPNVAKLSGKGDLYVDFAAGTVHGLVPLDITEDYFISGGHPTGRARGDLTLNATLASGANGFSGTATLNGIGSYAGTTQGQFFGPTGTEVGGAFSLSDGTSVAVGAFAGARDASVTDPTTTIPRLADLTSPTDLAVTVDTTPTASGELVKVNYDPATRAYRASFQDTHLSGAPMRTITLDASTENAAAGNASYRAYATTIDGGTPVTAAILRPDNPQIALSYTSIGEFVIQRGRTPFDWSRFFAVAGVPTTRAPSTGTATYSGIARGFAQVTQTNAGQSSSTLYDVIGASGMSVDFATQSFSATVNGLVGTATVNGDGSPVAGMPTRAFEALTYNFGTITGTTFHAGSNGHWFEGRFYGPNAAEFGAYFNDRQGTPNVSPVAVDIRGVAAGKRQ